MLTIANVSKSYAKGKIKAVDGLSLEVKSGEIFGFIGPNGAGKTTTIKMITGILPMDEGKITIGDIDIASQPVKAKKSMGYVPDSHEVYDRLKGIEYLHFIADIYGVDTKVRNNRIEELLSMFDLKDAISDPIRSYSHGMRQKLVIMAALIHVPPLWILDEPLTGLDPKSSHLLKEQMRQHCQKGNTVFFSTHILEVAERLCDRIGIIVGGKLQAIGTMDELRKGEQGASLEQLFLELTQEQD